MLRSLELRDAKAMYEAMCDTNVNAYMNIDGSKSSIENCENYIKNANANPNFKHFAIVDDCDNWVGTISLKNIDNEVKQAEYAIITSTKVHGKGYALKATKELLSYAFNTLNLNRVYLDVLKDNIRANKFYLKCGFKLEGTFRQAIFIKGQIYDLNWYSILKSDYEEGEKID